MTNKQATKLVIVGGGTAGWITAAACARLLGDSVKFDLIESEAIGTVGVGEATIPQIIRLNTILGFDEDDFVKHTNGTFKLGIEFVDWSKPGKRYLHTFGDAGVNLGNVPFHHYWRRYSQGAETTSLWHYSLHQHAADRNKFAKIDKVGNSGMTGLAYAYHFDAGLYAQYLRRYAEDRGVTRHEGIVQSVERHGESGDIASVALEDGTVIGGDFFIDCTGFRAMLLGQTLGVSYQDWSHWLPCNRALAAPSERLEPLPPYTRATARDAGWQWRIPLQHRTGNGHVYCSEFMSDDDAADILMHNLDSKALDDPRPLRFTTGRRETFWSHNCVAIGLSSGFLEPLESTSIHLIQSNVSRLISLLPTGSAHKAAREEYNMRTAAEFERVRDFLILHYHLNDREESAFWRYCKNMAIPDGLQHKIDLFAAAGQIGRDVDDLFREASWAQVMIGQGVTPTGYSAMASRIADDQLPGFMADIRTLIEATIDKAPNHADYINAHCAAAHSE